LNLLKFAHEMSVDTVQLISQLLTCILSFTVDMCLFPPLFNFFGIPLNVLVRKPLTVRVPKVGSHCPSQCAELTTFATFVCSLFRNSGSLRLQEPEGLSRHTQGCC